MKYVREEEEFHDYIVAWDDGEGGEFKIGNQLFVEQEKELEEVLMAYENILQKVPGKTRLA